MAADYSTTPAGLTQHVLQRHGCPIHYWIGGDSSRPLVVLLHGATMDHRMFNDQVTVLLPNYRVLVWDAPGHGDSQPSGVDISLALYADDVLAIVASLGVNQFVVIGQSMGGYIAQYLYKQAPQRLLAMVIIGAIPIAKPYSTLEVLTLKVSAPLLNLWPYENFSQAIAKQIAITEPVQRYALDAIRRVPRDEFRRIWKAVTLVISSEGMPDLKFNLPLLLVHGVQDTTGTIKRDMPLWAKETPRAEFHIIPEAGHNANQDNPDVMNRLMLDFLSRTVKLPIA
jgi:3-oxoadipate enol-lactonase